MRRNAYLMARPKRFVDALFYTRPRGDLMAALVLSEWYVTEEKVVEAVRRLVEAVDPLEIIAFGPRG